MKGVQRYFKWTWRGGEEGRDSLNKRVWDGSSARRLSKNIIRSFGDILCMFRHRGSKALRNLGFWVPSFVFLAKTRAGWKVLHPVK